MLYFLNIFTNHDYTFENYNMLFGTPLLLASVPLGLMYAFTKKQDKLALYDLLLRLVWFLTLLGIIVSMIIKIKPQVFQQNLTDQMLMLPIAAVFVFNPVGLKDALKILTRKGA